MSEFRTIVYPTDFSELSLHALSYALYLARLSGANFHCIHVVDDSYQYWMTVDAGAIPVGPSLEELLASAEKHLDSFIAENVPPEVTLTRRVLRGRAFLEIIRYARGVSADLIVIGTHGRSALKQVLLGSVADKIVHKAHCPVLTVRHPSHAFEMP